MQDTNNQGITDVEFKEIPTEAAASETEIFEPVRYLVNALINAGHPKPTEWAQDIDARAQTADNEKDRIFFTNRAIRLHMAEQLDRENITARMLVADGIDGVKWAALVDQAIVPWLMGKFDKKEETVAEQVQAVAPQVDPGYPDTPTLSEGQNTYVVEEGGINPSNDVINDTPVAAGTSWAEAIKNNPGYNGNETSDPVNSNAQ